MRQGLSVADRLVRLGKTTVSAGLLIQVADFLSQVQSVSVVDKGLLMLFHRKEEFAKTIERFGFTGRVAIVPEQGDRHLVMLCGFLVAAQVSLGHGKSRQRLGFAYRIAPLAADVQCFLGMRESLLVFATVAVNNTEPHQGQRLGALVAALAGQR